jgi:tRNA A37 threonylcarbamoyladenosine modification protein TsaB
MNLSSMNLIIVIRDKTVSITIVEKNKKINFLSFPEANNLSEKLLPAIDRLLKKNKLTPKDIKKISVSSDTPGSFTTPRIAKAVEKAWNFGVSYIN